MDKYQYKGPVTYYGKVTANNWTAETTAESREKAINNFKYQFRKEMKIKPSVGIVGLPGKIAIIQ